MKIRYEVHRGEARFGIVLGNAEHMFSPAELRRLVREGQAALRAHREVTRAVSAAKAADAARMETTFSSVSKHAQFVVNRGDTADVIGARCLAALATLQGSQE